MSGKAKETASNTMEAIRKKMLSLKNAKEASADNEKSLQVGRKFALFVNTDRYVESLDLLLTLSRNISDMKTSTTSPGGQ